jgi:hypothetical protein
MQLQITATSLGGWKKKKNIESSVVDLRGTIASDIKR